MANSYFENSRSFTPGTSADGEEVDDKFDSVESGFEAVEVATNAAIKLTNGDVSGSQVIPADAATRASKVIGFDISGALTLLASGATWRGDWTAPLLYNINDIVQDAAGAVSQDSLFICVTEHTSSDFAADSANWELMVNVGAVVAAKDAAEAAQVAAETAETNASISETVAVASGLQAVEAQGYAEEWANKAEDSLVSTDAGGNGVDEYSAKHHALKAAAAVTSHAASTSTHGVSGALVGTTDAQTLSNKTIVAASNTITTAPSGNLTSTNLNAALAELQTDIDTRATSAALAAEVTDLEAYADAGDAATLAAAEAYVEARAFWDFEEEILPPIITNAFYYAAHGLGAIPSLVEVVARCKTATTGFIVGDEYVLHSEHYYTKISLTKNASFFGVYVSSDWYLRSKSGTQLRMDVSSGKDNFSIVLRAKR